MIYSVSGKVAAKGENFIVVETGGLGLKLFAAARAVSRMPAVGEDVKLFSYLYVREDALELYGFRTAEELAFFEMLISVNGVGPRSALAILDVAELKDLASAIKENRPDLMTRASGIGRKTAERIILELKTKVEAKGSEATVERMESDADIVEALTGLGYRREEAKAAVGKVGHEPQGVEARLKAALKLLGKNGR